VVTKYSFLGGECKKYITEKVKQNKIKSLIEVTLSANTKSKKMEELENV